MKSPFLDLSTDLWPLHLNESHLVVVEKEVEMNTQEMLPVLQEFQSHLDDDSPWILLLDYIFSEWNNFIHFIKIMRLSLETAERLVDLNNKISNTRLWVDDKKSLLLSIGETKNSMSEIVRMEYRMAGWKSDLKALKEQVIRVFEESESAHLALEELESPLNAELGSMAGIREAKSTLEVWTSALHADWSEFEKLMGAYQKRLEESLAFQSMLQDLEAMNTSLLTKQNTITSLEIPITINEIDQQSEILELVKSELKSSEEQLNTLVEHGKNLIVSQEDAVASVVSERLDNLKSQWSDLIIFCEHQLSSFAHQRKIQVRI